MSVLNRLSRAAIREHYTHVGLLAGILPIYLSIESDDEAVVCERNWVPEVLLHTVCYGLIVGTWLLNFGGLRPAFPNTFPMFITGEIE